jgi:hypothetical protein
MVVTFWLTSPAETLSLVRKTFCHQKNSWTNAVDSGNGRRRKSVECISHFDSCIKTILTLHTANPGWPGTVAMIFKIFSPKNSAKNRRWRLSAMLNLAKIYYIIGFWENTPIFFAENCRKMQKIAIITPTADWSNFRLLGDCLLRPVFRSSPKGIL